MLCVAERGSQGAAEQEAGTATVHALHPARGFATREGPQHPQPGQGQAQTGAGEALLLLLLFRL